MSHSEQDAYHATIRNGHKVGSWLRILDEDEHPLWEMADITDGGVSFDISQSPDRTLDVTVLDIRGRLLSGAPIEEAAEAGRFVQAIYGKEAPSHGWFRFPLFTGPLSSGGLKRQGAEVSISATGKESLYLEPYVTWEAQHHAKGKHVVDAIQDIAEAQGERKFKLPKLDATLPKRLSIKPYSEAWHYIVLLAARVGRRPVFDGEGYLCLEPRSFKHPAYVFDPDVVLTPPETDDDYTTIINAARTIGGDPKGAAKPLHVPAVLPSSNPFSPARMGRHGVPRRAIAHDEIDAKAQKDLEEHSRSLLQTATKTVAFDCLPVPHLRPGTMCRIVGEYEEQPVDMNFLLRQGFFPLTANTPMTVGSWKPIAANWKALHKRGK